MRWTFSAEWGVTMAKRGVATQQAFKVCQIMKFMNSTSFSSLKNFTILTQRKTQISKMASFTRFCGVLLFCTALAHAQQTRHYLPVSANPIVFALEVPSTSVISTITTVRE
jgi:hypothetical protein